MVEAESPSFTTRNGKHFKRWHHWEGLGHWRHVFKGNCGCPQLFSILPPRTPAGMYHMGPKQQGQPMITDASEDARFLYKSIAPNIRYSNGRLIDTGSKWEPWEWLTGTEEGAQMVKYCTHKEQCQSPVLTYKALLGDTH